MGGPRKYQNANLDTKYDIKKGQKVLITSNHWRKYIEDIHLNIIRNISLKYELNPICGFGSEVPRNLTYPIRSLGVFGR